VLLISYEGTTFVCELKAKKIKKYYSCLNEC